jgi:hypothetical protein
MYEEKNPKEWVWNLDYFFLITYASTFFSLGCTTDMMLPGDHRLLTRVAIDDPLSHLSS